MAVSQITENVSLVAAEALTVHRFVFVDTGGLAAETNDSTQVAGVCQETVAIGVAAPIMTKFGAVVQVEADGAHALGAIVSAGAAGQLVAEAAAGNMSVGRVLEASAAAGDIISILFQPAMIHA